jgi:hypothetical protein
MTGSPGLRGLRPGALVPPAHGRCQRSVAFDDADPGLGMDPWRVCQASQAGNAYGVDGGINVG